MDMTDILDIATAKQVKVTFVSEWNLHVLLLAKHYVKLTSIAFTSWRDIEGSVLKCTASLWRAVTKRQGPAGLTHCVNCDEPRELEVN